jgi:signal transduction histidine kinase
VNDRPDVPAEMPASLPVTIPTAASAPFSELTARRLGPIRRFFVRHPVAMDVTIIAIFVAWCGLSALVATFPDESGSNPLAGLATSAVTAVVLFWRRRAPVLVTAAVVALLVANIAMTGTTAAFDLALAFAVYAVAANRPTSTAWATTIGAAALFAPTIWLFGEQVSESMDSTGETITADPRVPSIVSFAILTLIALAIGTSVRNRRQHIAELVERANALARDREQQAELARVTERSRIAREMHDVVAHSLSVMIALADGAGAALERSPDRARTALGELSETGRSALSDMRRVLGVLDRTNAPLEPQPGQPDLGELVERFRTAGLTVRAQGLDDTLPGDAGVQLAVYRIVQESLTNALRHAPGSTVDLTVASTPEDVTVKVVDHGGVRGTESPGAGRGLIGMRERAGVYGGTVEAGPWHDGWQVLATLPWRRDAR